MPASSLEAPLVTGRVHLVHERLTELGGSEAVVEKLAALCDDPRLFVPIADASVRPCGLAHVPVTTSFLQRMYRGGGHYAHLLPLLPLGMRRANLGDADLVVISHHAFANRVRVPAGVPAISYVHTPARWMWESGMRSGEGNRLGASGLAAYAATQRRADRRAAQRVHTLIANSTTVQRRIRTWWDRDAVVVHPPVDVDFYRPEQSVEREDFFLLAGRLVPYKRPQVAVEAAREAGVRLVVAGEGRSRPACERSAGPQTTFLGRVGSETLRDLFRRCRALIFPGEEDFGIVPVEAQACGAPVIALGAGGALDTVQPGRTGVLVDPHRDDAQGLAEAMDQFVPRFDAASIRANAERFSEAVFKDRMASLLQDVQNSGGRTARS